MREDIEYVVSIGRLEEYVVIVVSAGAVVTVDNLARLQCVQGEGLQWGRWIVQQHEVAVSRP